MSKAETIVKRIMDDLSDRCGVLDGIIEKIRDDLTEIVEDELEDA